MNANYTIVLKTVNLFAEITIDLLGFAAAQSSITLSDIRLSDGSDLYFDHIAHDDAATGRFTTQPLNDAPVAPAGHSVSAETGQPYTFDPLAEQETPIPDPCALIPASKAQP